MTSSRAPWLYRDRAEAGEILAARLSAYRDRDDVLVLGLPRGGVPVAFPVAMALGAPLDILAVRKLGVPGHEELAMGAIAAGGVRVLNRDVVASLMIGEGTITAVTERESLRLGALEQRFRGPAPAAPREGRFVVVVDDGLATGATMEAAIASCRQAGAAGITVAVPVGSPATVTMLSRQADEVVCTEAPARFRAVGLAYSDFAPVADEEVVALLRRAAERGL